MVKGLYTAYTGMIEEMRRMDVMTNNLANASTTGYKKEGTVNQSFDDQLAVRGFAGEAFRRCQFRCKSRRNL